MGSFALPSWLTMLILLPWVVVACVALAWARASRSSRPKKRADSPAETPPSETALAKIAADQAELFSTLGSLTTTVKRISSRHGMQALRERREAEHSTAPPRGASKAELLRYYGMSGKVGPAFAQAQLDLERKNNETEH